MNSDSVEDIQNHLEYLMLSIFEAVRGYNMSENVPINVDAASENVPIKIQPDSVLRTNIMKEYPEFYSQIERYTTLSLH
jgi:hypothetical protein